MNNKMGCFNDPAWKVCGWMGGVGWLTPTTYIQLAWAGLVYLCHMNKDVYCQVVEFSWLLLSSGQGF